MHLAWEGYHLPKIPQYIAKEQLTGSAPLPTANNFLPESRLDLRDVANGVNAFVKETQQKADRKRAADESLWLVATATQFDSEVTQEFEKQKLIDDGTSLTERFSKYYDSKYEEVVAKAPSVEAQNELKKNLLQNKVSVLNTAMRFEAEVNTQKNAAIIDNTTETLAKQVFHRPQDLDKYIARVPALLLNLPLDKRSAFETQIKDKIGVSAVLGILENIDTIPDLNKKMQAYKSFYNDIESGKWNKYLSSDKLIALTGEATSGIQKSLKEIDNQQKEKYQLAKNIYESSREDYFAELQATGSSQRISRSTVEAIAAQEKNPNILSRFDAEVETAKIIYKVSSSLDFNNPQEALNTINKYKPKLGESGFAVKQRTYEQLLSAVGQKYKQVNSDPAGTVKQTPGVAKAFDKGLQSGVNATVAAQKQLGIPDSGIRLLSNNEAKTLANEINALPPDRLEKKLQQLEQSYNFNYGSGSAYQKVLSELNSQGLNPLYGVAISLTGTPAFGSLIDAIKQGHKQLNISTGVDNKALDAAISNDLLRFTKAVSVGGTRPLQLNNIRSASSLLAKQYVATRGIDVNTAAKLAVKQIVHDNYNIVRNPKNSKFDLVIPKEVSGKRINTNSVIKSSQSIDRNELQNWFGTTYQNPIGTNPRITTAYGAVDAVHKKPHMALDFAGNTGDTVKPIGPGKVEFVGVQQGYGKTIVVVHADGKKSRYAHLNSIEVSKGQSVDYTSRLGGIGSTGRSTGPHLHLELIDKSGKKLNPSDYLDKPILGSKQGTSSIVIDRQTVEQAVRNPIWVLNAEGTGFNLAVDTGANGVVELRNHKGERFGINFFNHVER